MEEKERGREQAPERDRRKKRRSPLPGILLILILALVLLWVLLPRLGLDLGSFGLGSGTGGTSGPAAEDAAASSSSESTGTRALPAETAEASGEQAADTQTVVRVEETRITVNGEDCTGAEALRGWLEANHSDGQTYLLVDAHAVQQSYAEVRQVLEELSLPFAETTEET